MAERVFLREVNLDLLNKTLLFYQNSIGNVSAVVWDASLVLSKYLNKRSKKEEDWLRDLKVLELGSGLGCAGITAACFGADVVLTDLPDVVPQLTRTIELNRIPIAEGRGKATAMEFKWGSSVKPILDRLNGPPNIILASDVIYYEEALQPLAETLKALSNQRTEIILCQEIRETGRHQLFFNTFFNDHMDEFESSDVPESEQDELFHSSDIRLLSIRRKKMSKIANPKAPKYSTTQIEYLVRYMMSHKDFAAQRYASNTGTHDWAAEWQTLADKVNLLGTTKKGPDGWKQAWKDLKGMVRKKQGEINVCRRTTGNTTGKPVALTDLEKKVAAVLGTDYLEGLDVRDPMESTEEHLQALADGEEVTDAPPMSQPPSDRLSSPADVLSVPSRPLHLLTPTERRVAVMESMEQDEEWDRIAGRDLETEEERLARYELILGAPLTQADLAELRRPAPTNLTPSTPRNRKGPGLASVLSRSRDMFMALEERNTAAQEQTSNALVSLGSALNKVGEALQQSRDQHEMMLSVMMQQGRITEAALKAIHSLTGNVDRRRVPEHGYSVTIEDDADMTAEQH